jgi:hypothetical protein
VVKDCKGTSGRVQRIVTLAQTGRYQPLARTTGSALLFALIFIASGAPFALFRFRPPKQSDKLKNQPLLVRLESTEKRPSRTRLDFADIALSTWLRERLRQIAVRELERAARPIAFLDNSLKNLGKIASRV